MKNAIGLWVLAATLVAPQAILWADASAPGSMPGTASTTPSTPQTKKSGHKGHHHKKMKKSPDTNTSVPSQPVK